jgi:hypothetical protein
MNDWAKQRLTELHAAAPTRLKKTRSYARIPLDLAGRAAIATGGQRMMVWIWIIYQSWRQQTPTVVVSTKALRKIGIGREVKRHALRQLEAAGLITVEWRTNKNPVANVNG